MKRRLHITSGIILSLTIWLLAIALTGTIVGGEVFKFSYAEFGLGKIYPLIFVAYCIIMPIISKKKSLDIFFRSASLTLIIPALAFIFIFLSQFFSNIFDNPIFTVLYIMAMPAYSAAYCYLDSPEFTAVNMVLVAVMPFISLILYRIIKENKTE